MNNKNELVFKITYRGRYEDYFLVTGETLKDIGIKVNKELKKRNWERENCSSGQIDI